MYRHTGVDDCMRFRVLEVYPRGTAKHALESLERVADAAAFPIRRVQTERGGEWFAMGTQKALMDAGIKVHPVRPGVLCTSTVKLSAFIALIRTNYGSAWTCAF